MYISPASVEFRVVLKIEFGILVYVFFASSSSVSAVFKATWHKGNWFKKPVIGGIGWENVQKPNYLENL